MQQLYLTYLLVLDFLYNILFSNYNENSCLTRSLPMTSYAVMQVGTLNCIWLVWDPFLKLHLINWAGSSDANHFFLVVGFNAIYFKLQSNKVLMDSILSNFLWRHNTLFALGMKYPFAVPMTALDVMIFRCKVTFMKRILLPCYLFFLLYKSKTKFFFNIRFSMAVVPSKRNKMFCILLLNLCCITFLDIIFRPEISVTKLKP